MRTQPVAQKTRTLFVAVAFASGTMLCGNVCAVFDSHAVHWHRMFCAAPNRSHAVTYMSNVTSLDLQDVPIFLFEQQPCVFLLIAVLADAVGINLYDVYEHCCLFAVSQLVCCMAAARIV
jgi:hypothetical protein